MSLINDVLRDLDQRGAGASSAGAPPTVVQVRSVRRRLWPWWLLSAVVVGALLHLAWRDFGDENTGLDLPVIATASAPASLARGSPATATAVPAPMLGTPSPLTPAARPVMASADIQGPLPQASEATQPVEPAASEPGRPGMAPARPEADDSVAEQVPESPEPVIRIERAGSTPGPDDDPLLAARRALARDQNDLARQYLESRLGQAPADHEARLLLARVHEQAGRGSVALNLLEAGLNEPGPEPVAAALARALMERGQAERARDLLLANAPATDASNNVDYKLLLAAALRQTGQHDQALVLYQSLGDTSPHLGMVWIGLGSTLETLNQPQAARSAYQRALQTDDPRAIAFARGRLVALPPDTESAR
ncbi:MAG: hypothetical protein EA370_12970 [Wenzhouxiangella sp.]|nr:MAG: hypothetical protein EA370_12970 [Wenzhouxiangella sp.]